MCHSIQLKHFITFNMCHSIQLKIILLFFSHIYIHIREKHIQSHIYPLLVIINIHYKHDIFITFHVANRHAIVNFLTF
jgi:hypothetical protein